MTGKELITITTHSTMITTGSPHSMNPPASTDEDPVTFVEVLIPVVERLSDGTRTIVWMHQMVSLEELEDLRDKFRLITRLYWLIRGVGNPINWIDPAQ